MSIGAALTVTLTTSCRALLFLLMSLLARSFRWCAFRAFVFFILFFDSQERSSRRFSLVLFGQCFVSTYLRCDSFDCVSIFDARNNLHRAASSLSVLRLQSLYITLIASHSIRSQTVEYEALKSLLCEELAAHLRIIEVPLHHFESLLDHCTVIQTHGLEQCLLYRFDWNLILSSYVQFVEALLDATVQILVH